MKKIIYAMFALLLNIWLLNAEITKEDFSQSDLQEYDLQDYIADFLKNYRDELQISDTLESKKNDSNLLLYPAKSEMTDLDDLDSDNLLSSVPPIDDRYKKSKQETPQYKGLFKYPTPDEQKFNIPYIRGIPRN